MRPTLKHVWLVGVAVTATWVTTGLIYYRTVLPGIARTGISSNREHLQSISNRKQRRSKGMLRRRANVDFNATSVYFKRRTDRITPLDFNFVIKSNICEHRPTYLVIMVISMASHRRHRDAIRETWGGVNHNNTWAGTTLSHRVRVVFLFGKSGPSDTAALKKEAGQHKDIVLADFRESYFNLTYKVLMGLKWIKQYCSAAKYVMKSDEDTVVHIPWLLERLQSPHWNIKIIGPFFSQSKRSTGGKYSVTKTRYPFTVYPPHVKGNVYIMPISVAYQILEVSEHMPYVNMEDAHITGILAHVVGASHKEISRSEYSIKDKPGVCDIAKKRKFAGKNISPKYLREIWKKVLNPVTCK